MSFKGQLYNPLQTDGAAFLVNKKRALLQFEQGLGKTVIALAAAEKLFELKKARSCLIIGEAGYLWQWEKAIHTFTDSNVWVAKGPDRNYTNIGVGYTLMSYHRFRNDWDDISEMPYDIVVCDEAQNFANNKSKISRMLKRYNVLNDPPYRWALSGTAIRNKLEDLFNIMYWVDRRFLPGWPTFEERHINRNIMGGIDGYKNLEPLHEHLKHRVCRKTHADAAGQVPSIVGPIIHTVAPSPTYKAAQKTLLTALDKYAEDISLYDWISPRVRGDVSIAFSAVKQQLSTDKIPTIQRLVAESIAENETNKVVLFSFYKEPLYLLDKQFTEKGIETALFTGDESADEKQEAVRKFEHSASVLLCSNAGSRGLDLPFANFVYHLDIPPSYDILDQRNKRVTRLSSTHDFVTVNYLLLEDSIEKYYFDIVMNQGELLKATFDVGKDVVKIRNQSLRQYLNEYRDKGKSTG